MSALPSPSSSSPSVPRWAKALATKPAHPLRPPSPTAFQRMDAYSLERAAETPEMDAEELATTPPDTNSSPVITLDDETTPSIFNLRKDMPEFMDLVETRPEHLLPQLAPPPTEKDLAKMVFSKAFAQEKLVLSDLEPQRIAVAWRLVREFARLKGAISSQTPLGEMPSNTYQKNDIWNVPEEYSPAKSSSLPGPSLVFEDLLLEMQGLDEEYQCCVWQPKAGDYKCYPGLPLLPPPVPAKYLKPIPGTTTKKMMLDPEYDPVNDKLLVGYCKIMRYLAQNLHIAAGSPQDPDYGRQGLIGLLRPSIVRMAFPTRTQICTFEMLMIEKATTYLIYHERNHAKQALKQEWGLQEHEITSLIRMALDRCRDQATSDIEQDRALMLLRLEDYLRRCKAALDLNHEMKALKQITMIQGLVNMEQQDEMADFLTVVREFAADRESRRPMLALPSIPRALRNPGSDDGDDNDD